MKIAYPMKKIFVLSLLYAFFEGSAFTQQADLRYRLKPGMEFTTETSLHTSMVQKVMGIDQEIIMDMSYVLSSHVRDYNNGIYTLGYQYKKLKINTKSTMFAVEIDTEGPPSPQNNMMKVLTDKPFSVRMDERGRITDVKGIGDLISGIDTLSGIDAETRQNYKLSMEETFGRESFIQNMEQASVIYPSHPVSTGESWNYDYSTTSSNIILRIHNTATLKEITRNAILIRINSRIDTPPNDSINISGSTGHISMSGYQISEVRLDPSTGLITESNVSQEIRGKLILNDLPESDEPMEIPMTMTSKFNVTLTRKK